MVSGGLIAGIIFVIEDLITWKLGASGFPFWVALVVGFLIAFFFWKPLHLFIKQLLKRLGVG